MADAGAPTVAGNPSAGTARRVEFRELRIGRAWNIRGDGERAGFAAQVLQALGILLPAHPNTVVSTDAADTLWLGPRSWLLLARTEPATTGFDDARSALNAAGGALFDLSSSYAGWSVAGADAPRVLNRGCPLDVDPDAFRAGRCAQSVFGHIPVIVYRRDEEVAFTVLVPRSLAADAWSALTAAAAPEI